MIAHAAHLTYSASLNEIWSFSLKAKYARLRTLLRASDAFPQLLKLERGKSVAFPHEVLALAFRPQPDGWDCHFPTNVKEHAPQDVSLGTPSLYQKPLRMERLTFGKIQLAANMSR